METSRTLTTICTAAAAFGAAFLPLVSVADLRDDFRSPQGAARENTGPLFWMHGTETPERLREYVGRVAESGQGILTLESRPHIDWMREGWWRDVDIVLDECKKRGIKMMVYDDYWWPSQGMGGKYPIPEEFQCRDVKGTVYWGHEAPEKVENEVARIVVKEIEKGVFKTGLDGDKVIVYTWFTSNGGYRFPTVNGLDEAAVDWFISQYYQPYYDRYAKEFKDGTIPGFFFDEPQFRSWWGDALAKELKERGDDAGELLTALKFKLADPDEQSSAIYRYHNARSEVWGRTMYGRQSEWCRKHGVYSSGHFLEHAACYYSPVSGGGNVMQQMKYVEVPGVDLVCRQYYPSQRESRYHQTAFGQIPKYSSSVAHVYNRHNGKNWCEIFGAYGQDITYPQMKWLCDWHQYQGCYYMIPHSFNPKAPHDRDCPPYFYNGGYEPRYPLFRVWADYNNRCALMLSDGEHVCHIAQCVPGTSFHAGETIRPEMFAFAIQDAQLDSDWMGYDVVESARIGKNPRTGRPALHTENGREWYDILSLPATQTVPFPVLEKALSFAKAGGVVVGYGIKPCMTPTKDRTNDDARRIVDEIFAQPTALFIDGEPDGATLRAALAKNYPGTNQALAVRDFDFVGLCAADGRMLAVNHYVKDGSETLFIANQDFSRRRDVAVRAKWPVEKAELWDPMQGTVEKPVVENGLVKISLEPSQAVFLVWPRSATAGILPVADATKRVPPAGTTDVLPVAATVKETVTPVVVEGAEKESVVAKSLDYAKWIWHPVNPKAEGKVEFLAKIEMQSAESAEIVFSCDNEAFVYLNGKEIARQKTGLSNDGWRNPTGKKFQLNAGVNEIKVLADNVLPGYAGFVCSVRWAGGMLLSDADSWTVSRAGEVPVKPLEICRYGKSPWGRLGPASKITSSPFAESVATELAFTLPEIKAGERVYFVCDDVEGEKSAAVSVNGAYAGGFIGAPYRLDVTKAVVEGANTLVAKPFRLKNPRIERSAAVAACVLPANRGVVSFKDAAKIKSWDAWNDHKKPAERKERPCVTWKKLNGLDPGLKEIGRLAVRGSKDVKSSKWSVGCETMDRDYADWNAYKHLIEPLGVKHGRLFSGWAKTEQEKGAYDFTWLDPQVREMAAMGVKPWICLSYGNPVWGSDFRLGMRVKQVTGNPEAFEAWLRYVAACVERYKDVVDEWEIWNEPFHQGPEYAEMFYRTAKAIRAVQPAAKCFCTAITFPEDYKCVLERLKAEDALDLGSYFIYHPYDPNPDSSYAGRAEPLRRLVKGYSPAFDVMQGEVGCPAQLEFAHALKNIEWTEYSQAKWNLRRAVGDAVRSIPSNVFTMIDLQYTFMLQSFGLVRSNTLKEHVYRRPSYYAMQNVYSIFDDEMAPKRHVVVKIAGRDVACDRFERSGQNWRFYWFCGERPDSGLEFSRIDLSIPERLERPVWIEMITGRVFEIPEEMVETKDDCIVLRGIPMWDSPVCIVSREAVVFAR